MTMPADRERDRRSFQDLAKMASGLTPPPSSVGSLPSGVQRAAEAKKDDSGIVDLAAASQADPGATARARTTPLASQALFDEEPQSHQAPLSAPLTAAPSTASALMAPPFTVEEQLQQPAPSMPPIPASVPPHHALTPSAPPVGVAPVAGAVRPLPASGKKRGSGTVIALAVGGLVTLGAAAAGSFFFLKAHKGADANASATAQVATAPSEPPIATAKPSSPAPTFAAEAAPASEPSTASNALPTTAPNVKVAAASRGIGAKAAAQAKAAAHGPAPQAEGPTMMTEKDLAATSSGAAGDLGTAMKKEVGDEPAKTPAAATTGPSLPAGSVPQKPSQGAVTGAIGAVLPQARACLGPDDPISRASIVFSSDGSVQNVNVSGAAAGKPAEACIKSALMKAKLQPFAEPSYMANITVRHN